MKVLRSLLALVLLSLMVGGCSVSKRRAGVEPIWREVPGDSFRKGETTMEGVLELLGPPSQLLDLDTRTVFYYLLESVNTESLLLVVWNQSDSVVEYDRAIFFFDEAGILSKWSVSRKPGAESGQPEASQAE